MRTPGGGVGSTPDWGGAGGGVGAAEGWEGREASDGVGGLLDGTA